MLILETTQNSGVVLIFNVYFLLFCLFCSMKSALTFPVPVLNTRDASVSAGYKSALNQATR